MSFPKFFYFGTGLIIISLIIGVMVYQQFFSKEISSLPKKTVLFLCVHNTFRSQVAEAYF